MNNIIYKELSYEIVNTLFKVFNQLGPGYQEKHYQKALELEFAKRNINFVSQAPYKIAMQDKIIGRFFMDFIVENKIVLEIKRGDHFAKTNFDQVVKYLKVTGLRLGILANFTSKGIKFKRVLNVY